MAWTEETVSLILLFYHDLVAVCGLCSVLPVVFIVISNL